uniref:Uncharacterized protein n=1 Tax=Cacopsylla melanoneura TaxID=428564 RepID=A0A8D9A318_9HEMI
MFPSALTLDFHLSMSILLTFTFNFLRFIFSLLLICFPFLSYCLFVLSFFCFLLTCSLPPFHPLVLFIIPSFLVSFPLVEHIVSFTFLSFFPIGRAYCFLYLS